MNKKFFTLLLVMSMLSIVTDDFAQNDARILPYYIRAEESGAPRTYLKRDYYKPGVIPPEANKPHPLPDFLLDNSGIKIIPISGSTSHQSETWITMNPNNPDVMVAGANDFRFNSGQYNMGAYYTADGGKTWSVSKTPDNLGLYIGQKGDVMTNFDAGLAFDTKGSVYYSYGFAQTLGDGQGDNGVFVTGSTDGGKTWQTPSAVTYSSTGTTTQPFNDRYTIACDVVPGSSRNDYLYITWQRMKGNPSGICFAYSKDHNENWSNVISVTGGSEGATQSPMPAIGPNGEVYVAWERRLFDNMTVTDACVQKTTDLGKNWFPSPSVAQSVTTTGTVNSTSGRNVLADKQNIRISSYVQIAVDVSNSPRRGWVYIVQSGVDNGKSCILMARSTDGGIHWKDKIRVDDNNTGTDVFMPSICVDPKTGVLAFLYYSSQNDTNNKGVDAYLAISNDGGETFSRVRLTPQTWYLSSQASVSEQGNGNFYWGDYTSIVAYNGKIYPCFWMPNKPKGDFFTDNCYIAMVSPMPTPPTNLTGVLNSVNPDFVDLKWSDPVKNIFGEDLSSFKIQILRDNNKIAEVDKGVQAYTDNTAQSGNTYTYSIKAVTPENYESGSASVTVVSGGSTEPNPPVELIPRPAPDGILLSWKNPTTHIDNTAFTDFKKINIYEGDNLVKTIEGAQLQAGSYSTALINFTANTFHKIKIKAVSVRGEKTTESQASEEVIGYAGAPLTSFKENFDGSQPTVASYNLNSTGGWGKTTAKAVSAPNAFTDSPSGNYKQGENAVIFAPAVPTGNDTTLSFSEIALIMDKDIGVVSVSNDFGKTWNNIAYINKNRSSNFKDNLANSDWFGEHLNIKKYLNDTIFIKFNVVGTPGIKNLDGWVIDNLQIDQEPEGISDETYPPDMITMKSYPNPSNGKVSLNVGLDLPGSVTIALYDVMGNRILDIAQTDLVNGEHSYPLDLSDKADGIYYCRVTVNGTSKTLPVIIAR